MTRILWKEPFMGRTHRYPLSSLHKLWYRPSHEPLPENTVNHDAITELLRREPDPNEYAEIRDLWKAHSIAEDNRDLDGLIATLTDDCVYELPQNGARWEGHDGAREFYKGLLGAIPDVGFRLQYIVIGPQGVCEEATATGTFVEDWLDFRATGTAVKFKIAIFFPWDPEKRKFRGETVYFGADT